MAQVFQCDACKRSGVEHAGTVAVSVKSAHAKTKECCVGCLERVDGVLNPKPRGPKPDA